LEIDLDTQMEPSLDGWISVCQQLTPYENFALIGLLFLRSRPPLSILAPSNIVNDENARGAEKWSESRFRQLLLLYCDKYKKPKWHAASTLIDKANVVRGLASLFVSTLAVPLGIAVAFLYCALGKSLDDWCQKYSQKKYNGQGKYFGNFPEKEVMCFFDVTYLPQIVELVEDPAAYPLEGYKIRIRVDSETNGKIKVPSTQERNSIEYSFNYDKNHSYDFTDTQSNKKIIGEVDDVSYMGSDGPMVLRFKSSIRYAPSFSGFGLRRDSGRGS